MSASPYSPPGLCTLLRVLAILSIGGGAVLAVLSFVLGAGALTTSEGHSEGATAAGGIIFSGSVAISIGWLVAGVTSGITLLVIAAALDYLAQTAFHAERANDLQAASQQRFATFENTLFTLPLKVRTIERRADPLFHYEHNGEEAGPVSAANLRALFDSGVVNAETRVYRSGDGEWRQLQNFPELLSAR